MQQKVEHIAKGVNSGKLTSITAPQSPKQKTLLTINPSLITRPKDHEKPFETPEEPPSICLEIRKSQLLCKNDDVPPLEVQNQKHGQNSITQVSPKSRVYSELKAKSMKKDILKIKIPSIPCQQHKDKSIEFKRRIV